MSPDKIERICAMAVAYGELGEFDLAEERIGNVKALDPDCETVRDAGIAAAYSLADYAGSVALAIDDAANQLAGLARRTAAELG